MGHTLETLGVAMEELTKKIDEDVLPVVGEFEKFKKAQDAAAEAGSTKDDKEPTELEKALTTALDPVMKKLDAMETRLKKVEDTPGDANGNPADSPDDDKPAPVAKTAEERVELEKAKVAAVGDKMFYGRPQQ